MGNRRPPDRVLNILLQGKTVAPEDYRDAESLAVCLIRLTRAEVKLVGRHCYLIEGAELDDELLRKVAAAIDQAEAGATAA